MNYFNPIIVFVCVLNTKLVGFSVLYTALLHRCSGRSLRLSLNLYRVCSVDGMILHEIQRDITLTEVGALNYGDSQLWRLAFVT